MDDVPTNGYVLIDYKQLLVDKTLCIARVGRWSVIYCMQFSLHFAKRLFTCLETMTFQIIKCCI
uniref:Uncharacterized protein n=1 Tax=Rhizophora mucronata TaxID=61149 RepID=A0A2P2PJ68_RHIMU